jgi:uncharacterized protein YciI
MFAITLTYTAPLDEVDASTPEHIEWIATHTDAGEFLTSGRRVPRTGGVILAPSEVGAEKLAEIIAQDPFHQRGLAEYEVTEFTPRTTAPGFELLRGL